MTKLNLPDAKYAITYTSAMKKELKRSESGTTAMLSRTGIHSDLFGK